MAASAALAFQTQTAPVAGLTASASPAALLLGQGADPFASLLSLLGQSTGTAPSAPQTGTPALPLTAVTPTTPELLTVPTTASPVADSPTPQKDNTGFDPLAALRQLDAVLAGPDAPQAPALPPALQTTPSLALTTPDSSEQDSATLQTDRDPAQVTVVPAFDPQQAAQMLAGLLAAAPQPTLQNASATPQSISDQQPVASDMTATGTPLNQTALPRPVSSTSTAFVPPAAVQTQIATLAQPVAAALLAAADATAVPVIDVRMVRATSASMTRVRTDAAATTAQQTDADQADAIASLPTAPATPASPANIAATQRDSAARAYQARSLPDQDAPLLATVAAQAPAPKTDRTAPALPSSRSAGDDSSTQPLTGAPVASPASPAQIAPLSARSGTAADARQEDSPAQPAQDHRAPQAADDLRAADPASLFAAAPGTGTAPVSHTATAFAATGTDGQLASAPADQVAARISAHLESRRALSAARDIDSISMKLSPEHLGKVAIRLDFADGTVTAHISAERSDTLALLQGSADGLKQALQSSGLQTTDNGLNFSLSPQGQDSSFMSGQNPSFGQSQGQNARPGWHSSSSSSTAGSPAADADRSSAADHPPLAARGADSSALDIRV